MRNSTVPVQSTSPSQFSLATRSQSTDSTSFLLLSEGMRLAPLSAVTETGGTSHRETVPGFVCSHPISFSV